MNNDLLNCWEIMHCDCELGGGRNHENGICPAYTEQMGHSCWIVAGTLCTTDLREELLPPGASCMTCKVFRRYNRNTGTLRHEVEQRFPAESQRHDELQAERRQRQKH